MNYRKNREAIEFAKATISIQGSETHYSTPRVYLDNIEEYEALEIAMWLPTGEWINPHTDELFKDFVDLEELKEHYGEGDSEVGFNVPIEVVRNLLKFLEGLS